MAPLIRDRHGLRRSRVCSASFALASGDGRGRLSMLMLRCARDTTARAAPAQLDSIPLAAVFGDDGVAAREREHDLAADAGGGLAAAVGEDDDAEALLRDHADIGRGVPQPAVPKPRREAMAGERTPALGDEERQVSARAMGYVLGYGARCFELYGMRTWIVAFWTFVAARHSEPAWLGPATVSVVYSLLAMPASILGNEAALHFGRYRALVLVMTASAAVALAIGVS